MNEPGFFYCAWLSTQQPYRDPFVFATPCWVRSAWISVHESYLLKEAPFVILDEIAEYPWKTRSK